MLHHRMLAVCIAVVSIGADASAQDCDRYQWACEGWSGPRSPSNLPGVPLQITPGPQSDLRSAPAQAATLDAGFDGRYASLYAPVNGEPFAIPAVRMSEVDPAYLRKSVYYPTSEPAGTIIIDPQNHFLYLIQESGRALRYGVGVGRDGFGWSGVATVHNKQGWPDWYPPREMVQRQPELRRQLGELRGGLGMPGGPRNPLGARAMYLWQGNRDTLFRIHGTIEPWTIGKSVSSGCIRMINQDVIDLYERASVGTRVVVLLSR